MTLADCHCRCPPRGNPELSPSLCPVPAPSKGPLAVLAVTPDAVPAWMAIPGLLLVTAALIALKARRLQIFYAE